MKITDIECLVLLAPGHDPSLTSSAQDSFVVLVHTDEGLTGIGESDVIHGLREPAWKRRAPTPSAGG